MSDRTRRFEAATGAHLHAAYALARWLLRDDRLAEDAVQDAWLRAFRFFDDLRGDGARPWLLGIVRNACHDVLRQRRQALRERGFDDVDADEVDAAVAQASSAPALAAGDPARAFEQRELGRRIDAAIEALSPPLREVIVLRELQELPYEEIAAIAGVPLGTVMSRLSRARAALRDLLADEIDGRPTRERHART